MSVGVNVALVGQWKAALSVTKNLAHRFKQAQERAVAQEAHMMAAHVVARIDAGIAPALAATTLAVRERGGSKTLISTGGLRRSIRAHRVNSDTWFVGILKSAKSKSGSALYNIGSVHEFGATVVTTITPKAHRFLMAKFKHGGPRGRDSRGRFKRGSLIKGGGGIGIAVIKIPPRPFLRPTFEKHAQPEAVRKRFEQRFAKLFVVG